LSRTEIVHAAQREAERIVDEAKERAGRKRLEAEDYIDQKLAAFEILLNKTLATVARGREQLRGETQTGAPRQVVEGQVESPAPATPPFDAAQQLGEPAV
jgi:vacuolar-type H+-ATPase subunit E/Vma4